MPTTGTTALVIGLPAAEPLLAAARLVNPALVRPGLPAHATVLYPFLPAAELTDGVEAEVRDLAASLRPADVDLTEVVTARGFVAVGADALEPVAAAFRANWPHLRPYGGRFGPRPPVHVTVALDAAEEEAERIAAQLAGLLPVRARAEALTLAEVTAEGWRLRLSAPFGDAGERGDAEA